jgi:hypothetical protein
MRDAGKYFGFWQLATGCWLLAMGYGILIDLMEFEQISNIFLIRDAYASTGCLEAL